jgi:hypothetical protein
MMKKRAFCAYIAALSVLSLVFIYGCGNPTGGGGGGGGGGGATHLYTLTRSITTEVLTTEVVGTIEVTPEASSYPSGTTVEMTATALDPAYMLSSWEGAVTGDANPCCIIMNGNKNVTAVFKIIPPYQSQLILSVWLGLSSFEAAGTIEQSGTGWYYGGTTVVLTEEANPGYVFEHWNGDIPGAYIGSSAPTMIFTMPSRTIEVLAQFLRLYDLSVSVTPEGAGTIEPWGGAYMDGTTATVTAENNSGYIFDHWSGDLSGSSTTGTVTMDGNKNATAVFKHIYSLSVSVTPEGAGTIEPWGGAYTDGTTATITAENNSGHTFDHWSGDLTSSNSTETILMDGNKTVTAQFDVVHAIGDRYGGGIIFYIDGTGKHGLIAAATNESFSEQWGSHSITTEATDSAVGTGQANTTQIMSVLGAGDYAAKICDAYSTTEGGVPYDDWFLPSKDELNLMYTNLWVHGLGGFYYDGMAIQDYWSSTEDNLQDAWYQFFQDGSQEKADKTFHLNVRAVRAF